MDSVLNCMVSDLIGPGNLVHEFESLVAGYLGMQGAIAFSSYYVALMIAVETLELQPGDKVIISALSPVIYLNILEAEGLEPLILDVNLDSGLIEPAEVEKILDQNPKAILLHYTLGFLPVIEEFLKFNLPVIEDISQSFGAALLPAPAEEGAAAPAKRFFGTFGDLAVLSLKPQDIITTAEGGMVLAYDKKYWQKLKALKNVVQDQLLMPDLNASLGISQMKMLDTISEKRKNIHSTYKQALMKSRHKTLFQQAEYDKVPYTFPVFIASDLKEVQKYSRKKNIETEPAFLHSIIGAKEEGQLSCKNAKTLLMCTILFPLYPMLGKEQINTITRILSTLP